MICWRRKCTPNRPAFSLCQSFVSASVICWRNSCARSTNPGGRFCPVIRSSAVRNLRGGDMGYLFEFTGWGQLDLSGWAKMLDTHRRQYKVVRFDAVLWTTEGRAIPSGEDGKIAFMGVSVTIFTPFPLIVPRKVVHNDCCSVFSCSLPFREGPGIGLLAMAHPTSQFKKLAPLGFRTL